MQLFSADAIVFSKKIKKNFLTPKLYILTISISKTSNKIRLTSYYYKLSF